MEHTQTEFILTKHQKSQFGIIIRFDRQTEDFFNRLIAKLAQTTGNATWLRSGQPPHVSMGIFDIVDKSDPIQVMENVLRSLHSFSMTFDSLGAFLPGTLFAAPIMTDELITMNRAIHAVADRAFVPLSRYVYGKWTPHLTLAAELTHAELTQAFDTAASDWAPISAQTVSISLVHAYPYYEELVVPLK